MSIDLNALMLDLTGLTDQEAEERGRAEYRRLYARGDGCCTLTAYDGLEVMFFEDRFDHAFFTTSDRYRKADAKDILARDRVERIAWIGPILRGEVAHTQCWESAPTFGRDPRRNRLCIASSELYTIWLEPLKSGAWKFSTAYVVLGCQASEYKRGRRCVWKV